MSKRTLIEAAKELTDYHHDRNREVNDMVAEDTNELINDLRDAIKCEEEKNKSDIPEMEDMLATLSMETNRRLEAEAEAERLKIRNAELETFVEDTSKSLEFMGVSADGRDLFSVRCIENKKMIEDYYHDLEAQNLDAMKGGEY